jgi:carotenoid cleavage dioxygenase
MMKHSRVGPNDGAAPALERWTLDLAAGKVRTEEVDGRGQEFPRVNESLLGSRHRYGYCVELIDTEASFDSARYLKHDFVAGTTHEHDFGPGRRPSELVFVPSERASSEDDGWLIGYVYDGATDRSDLVILDAHDFTAPAVATVHLPTRVPFGFHGSWFPDA